jgi:hypothetical protein
MTAVSRTTDVRKEGRLSERASSAMSTAALRTRPTSANEEVS